MHETMKIGSSGQVISRRALIAATLGTGVALSVMAASSRSVEAADEHAGHGGHMMPHDTAAHHQSVIDAALTCVNRGNVCLNHCYTLLGEGDPSLANCVRTVSAMLPMTSALVSFAALDAPRLKDLARLCADVCGDCEAECRKHQDHHAACRACADSCADCIKECKALIAT
jgi:Cys-rich four helix bundle protein (predicted Tat secretion target)